MESEPSFLKKRPEFNKKLAAALAIPLASIALVGAGGEKIKQIAIAADVHFSAKNSGGIKSIPLCQGRQKVTVSKGDNQWSLEQRYVKGADRVFQDEIGTITVEQHPGDGILEPGDKLIMPERCERKLKPRN